MTIKNIVFDIGNVLVKWAPYEVIGGLFSDRNPVKFYEQIRPVWIDLNLGKLSENQAIEIYQQQLNIERHKLVQLMDGFKTSQTPIPGSFELLHKLYSSNIPLYAITDNTKEIIEYHHLHSNFLHYFKGVVVSANIGISKPNKAIYQYLLDQYKLNAAETIFIDDTMINVEGAILAGIHAFQFIDAKSCELQLNKFISMNWSE
jgi:putative hydrolase of the HAD superfamily